MSRTTLIRSLFSLIAAATLLVLQVGSAFAGAPAQDLPLRFTGDGITLVVTELDESSAKVSGTIQLKGGSPLPFTVDLTVNSSGLQKGLGRVTQGGKSRRISTAENEDGSIRVSYRAKRYVVTQVEGTPQLEVAPRPVAQSGVKSLRLRQHTFKDPGFNNQPSHTMLVPVGWKVEGGAFYYPEQFFKVMPSQEITLTSPEGLMLRIDPELVAKDRSFPPHLGMQRPPEGSSDGGVPIIYFPGDIPSWRTTIEKKIIPNTYPKATDIKVIDVGLVPELTEEYRRQMASNLAAQNQNQVPWDSKTHDAFVMGAESRYTLDGVQYEEISIAAITVMVMDNEIMGREVFWTQEKGLTMRAPVGQLAESMSLLGTIANSLQMTDPWLQARAQRFAQVMRISAQVALNGQREAAKRSSIMAKAYSDVADMSHASYQARSASSDDVHGRVIRSINETEVYTGGDSAPPVQLPSGYERVFSNGNGEYLLTNDALFDPAVDTTSGNWTPMRSMDAR